MADVLGEGIEGRLGKGVRLDKEPDVFDIAIVAKENADEAYAVAEEKWIRIQQKRGSNSVTNAIVPLIKRYWPAVAASGGISALVTDPSMVSGLLSKLSSFIGG